MYTQSHSPPQHDIFDGWGSYPEPLQLCDVFQVRCRLWLCGGGEGWGALYDEGIGCVFQLWTPVQPLQLCDVFQARAALQQLAFKSLSQFRACLT